MATSPEINGSPPVLTDAICEGARCQQYWHRRALRDEANVVFLRFAGVWHRLTIDCSIIVWRIETSEPQSFEAPELDASYRVVDVSDDFGVRGERLLRYEMRTITGGVQVEFIFAQGQRMLIRHVADRTSLVR